MEGRRGTGLPLLTTQIVKGSAGKKRREWQKRTKAVECEKKRKQWCAFFTQKSLKKKSLKKNH